MVQLALDLAFPPRFGADDFLVAASNADAHALLLRWPDWPSRVMLLVGPEGAGKTHLAAIWADIATARSIPPPLEPVENSPQPGDTAFLLEDIDRSTFAEASLFHLLNEVHEREQFLLLTARSAPDSWRLKLPDLLSRLRRAPLLRIGSPDEDLLRTVLVKLFVDRQLMVDAGVVDYLALHLDRSLGKARKLVDALDRASLESQRRITRPIAARVLAEQQS